MEISAVSDKFLSDLQNIKRYSNYTVKFYTVITLTILR
jgi:hypothetical protein